MDTNNSTIARRMIEAAEIETLERKLKYKLKHERALREADYVMGWVNALPHKPDLKLDEFKLMVEAILDFTGMEATRENIRSVAGKMVQGLAK